MNPNSEGFLVVLADERDRSEKGPYEGVDRVPPYPGDAADDAAALDEYVFGDVKNPQTNLITSPERARDLARRLSRCGRNYEVIFCCKGPDSEALADFPAADVEHLGFDIGALQADYWSIVDDFSSSPWAERFRSRLNEHGLFWKARDAEQYLREYKHRNEPDCDAPLEVVYVARLRTEP